MSAKTGVAPARTIKFIVETQVIEGVTTSSPGPMSSAFNSRCMPAVADESATQSSAPVYSQNFDSNSAVFTPVVIQPDFKTSITAEISSSLMDGFENGRNWFLKKIPP